MRIRSDAVRPSLIFVTVFALTVFNFVTTLQQAMRIPSGSDRYEDLLIQRSLLVAGAGNGETATTATEARHHATLRWEEGEALQQQNERSHADAVVVVDWPPTEMLDALCCDGDGAAAMLNTPNRRRLVVAASNSEFVDFADNFANSLLAVNVSNFVLVPLDEKAYHTLYRAYPKHTLPVPPLLESFQPAGEGEAAFGSAAFKKLTATRPAFLRPFLEKGYAVLYNDIDMVWVQNAWDVIDERDKIDSTTTTTSMLWHDGPGQLCTCMIYLLPTKDGLSLLSEWQDEILTGKYTTDQFAFIAVAKRLKFPFGGGSTANGVRVYRSDEEFPHGKFYSWDEQISSNEKAVIIHNNWIVGKQEKRDRFESAGLWNPSGRVLEPQR